MTKCEVDEYSLFIFKRGEVILKGSVATVIATLVLSLIGWAVFYFIGAPLKSHETVVLVGVCAGLILIMKWVYAVVSKKGD